MTEKIKCPECGHEMYIDPECWPEGDDAICSYRCHECEKEFMLHLQISYDLSAYSAPCLNGAPHEFGMFPFEMDGDFKGPDGKIYKHFRAQMCKICGHEEREWS